MSKENDKRHKGRNQQQHNRRGPHPTHTNGQTTRTEHQDRDTDHMSRQTR